MNVGYPTRSLVASRYIRARWEQTACKSVGMDIGESFGGFDLQRVEKERNGKYREVEWLKRRRGNRVCKYVHAIYRYFHPRVYIHVVHI